METIARTQLECHVQLPDASNPTIHPIVVITRVGKRHGFELVLAGRTQILIGRDKEVSDLLDRARLLVRDLEFDCSLKPTRIRVLNVVFDTDFGDKL